MAFGLATVLQRDGRRQSDALQPVMEHARWPCGDGLSRNCRRKADAFRRSALRPRRRPAGAVVRLGGRQHQRLTALAVDRYHPHPALEILKIAAPLLLAWYFHKHRGAMRWRDNTASPDYLLLIPFGLIAKQPDLGTAILVGAGWFLFVIFFAGLPWKIIVVGMFPRRSWRSVPLSGA